MLTIKEANDRYLSERIEKNRCEVCHSKDGGFSQETSLDGLSIERDGWFCNDCGDYTAQDTETFAEWAERVDLKAYYNEID